MLKIWGKNWEYYAWIPKNIYRTHQKLDIMIKLDMSQNKDGLKSYQSMHRLVGVVYYTK